MRTICFITGTRADYGITAPLMQRIKENPDARIQVIATNMHLSPQFGMTAAEIEADGFTIDARIESLLSADTPSATVKSMALTQMGLAEALPRLKPDLIVILGDRYEMLAAASAALIFRIPVAHLYGGETTEGAYDDAIRHAITKLSWLHFTSTPQYRDRIVSMGEDPARVFWAGSLAAETIASSPKMPLAELGQSIAFDLGEKYICCTFHPVTTQPGEEERQTAEFLAALQTIVDRGWKVLFTMPNSDTGANAVARLILEWERQNPDMVKTVKSLGRLRYYSALKNASAIAGNSSSGLIEAPSFGIPTVNVGDRQKGRARSESVIDTPCNREDIAEALNRALSPGFRRIAEVASNPYARPGTLDTIAGALLTAPLTGTKTFYEKPATPH